MGNTQALGFAEAVNDGQVSLWLALHYHFTANHWPPLPVACIEPAELALKKANEGEWEELIDISDIGTHQKHGTDVPVNVLIEDWHLYPFVTTNDEDGEI